MGIQLKMKCKSSEPRGDDQKGKVVRLELREMAQVSQVVLESLNTTALDEFQVGQEFYVDIKSVSETENDRARHRLKSQENDF